MTPIRLTLAAFILAVPAHAAAQPAAAPAASAAEAQMEHVSIRAIGSGSPVVLIPGLATPRAVWDRTAADLARSHRVLLVQVNGFGGDAARGNAQPGIVAGVTADIARYLAEQRLPPAAVIGHSLGGVVGMRLARDHPERVGRLMVVDALPFFGMLFDANATAESLRPTAEATRRAVQAIAPGTRRPSADDPAIRTMSISAAGRLQVSTWSVAADPRVVGQAMYEAMQEDLRSDLAQVARVPTTVLHAVPPPIAAQARAIWAGAYGQVPAIRLIPVENSFHFIMIDQPELFAREVAAFLAR